MIPLVAILALPVVTLVLYWACMAIDHAGRLPSPLTPSAFAGLVVKARDELDPIIAAVLLVALLADVLLRLTWGYVASGFDRPRELLFTQQMNRYRAGGPQSLSWCRWLVRWRLALSTRACKVWMNPFAVGGSHCRC